MFDDLLSALQRLDKRLEQAAIAAQAVYGSEAATDPYRGLRIDRDEIERLLDREPGIPLFAVDSESDRINNTPLNWLKQTFNLSEFDLDTILIALAPEIDLRYERLYAYLQDDVTRKRPSVDLALNLLCLSAEAKLLQQGLEPRLSSWCQLIDRPTVENPLPIRAEIAQILPKLVARSQRTNQPLLLYFSGLHPLEKRRSAIALAAQLNGRLLIADFARTLAVKEE